MIAFVCFNTVMHLFLVLIKQRRQHFLDVQLGVLNRFDQDLGRNPFVQFADATTRGEQHVYVKTQLRRMNEIEEEQNDSKWEAMTMCASAGGGGTRNGERAMRCVLNVCDPNKSFESTLAQRLRSAWDANGQSERKDPCASSLLIMLERLGELQLKPTHTNDQHTQWHRLQSGIDAMRVLIYRTLDVTDTPTQSLPSALDVIKEAVIPELQMGVVECTDLRPLVMATRADPDTLFDRSYAGAKAACWEVCRRDPNCLWAYYDQDKGCIFARDGCGGDELEGCVPAGSVLDTRLLYEPQTTATPKRLLLIKPTFRDKSVFVTVNSTGIHQSGRSIIQQVPSFKDHPPPSNFVEAERSRSCMALSFSTDDGSHKDPPAKLVAWTLVPAAADQLHYWTHCQTHSPQRTQLESHPRSAYGTSSNIFWMSTLATCPYMVSTHSIHFFRQCNSRCWALLRHTMGASALSHTSIIFTLSWVDIMAPRTIPTCVH